MAENEHGFEMDASQSIETLALAHVEKALHQLSFDYYGERLFRAADPGYPQNFTRDSLISARLMEDEAAARAQLRYSAMFQGVEKDPATGEEPGKIHHERHHELPVFIRPNGLGTAYNACDTTALFLETAADLANSGDAEILDELAANITAATDYIVRHVEDGLFIEDPKKFSGAETYGLTVTYWKDSVLNAPDRTEPAYPIVYTQPHFQNANALLQIGKVTDNIHLVEFAEEMFSKGFEKLWSGDHFVTAIDDEGVIDGPSTDSLMSLLHIPADMLPAGYAQAIEEYMIALETPAGYLSGLMVKPESNGVSTGFPGISDDEYHTKYIWAHEQGLLHMAASKHGLRRAMGVAERVVKYIEAEAGIFPELLEYNEESDTYVPAGPNSLQLWSVAMYKYFVLNAPVALLQTKQ